jgi:asparagine synthase (glutamine-hydrolysing)
MCGIAGFLDTGCRSGNRSLQDIVLGMTNRLRHRGPDDVGTWTDAEMGIALGHRRLSILDLSPEGRQPMRSACGRYVISFNGEIYNFRALRAELESFGYTFRGRSDTEVMLSCISHWGIWSALKRFNGMFAFALWDRQERRLHLVRDRMGEKPLYYGWSGRTFVFGSELKALRAHPDFDRAIDREALRQYVVNNYVPAPRSIYRGISKLLPASLLTLEWGEAGASPKIAPYWSLDRAVEDGLAEPFAGTDDEAVEYLDGLLRDAVKLRMESDVPLGAFLSGGIDSSTIVALMQAQSSRPVRTFTIGFHETGYNEAKEAMAVARHLGTAHTELYVTPEETMGVIPRLPTLYDEPFSDQSQIPTYLVSELARRDVTVALSGDGGDELFGGYGRYFFVEKVWRSLRWMPGPARTLLARALKRVPKQSWQALGQSLGPFLPDRIRKLNLGEKVHTIAGLLATTSSEAVYEFLTAQWRDLDTLLVAPSEMSTGGTCRIPWKPLPTIWHSMMYSDTMSYLPDDILAKVDRASMGVGLEARVPLLDHRVVECAWRLPLGMKIRHGRGKWLLRKLLHRYVPASLIERPKMGFGVPIDSWLRGPLREWAEELIDEKRLRDQGFFHPEPIRSKWAEHLSGTSNGQYPLWAILMFQAWLEHERQVA